MIFNKGSLSAVVLYALASLGSVSAVPSPIDYPEVIPGPGMPSLASLGLTSKDLYEATVPLGERELLVPRYFRSCLNRCGRAPLGEAQACVNYLRNLGQTPCVVPAGRDSVVTICTAGQAAIYGLNYLDNDDYPVSTACSNVAIAGQGILNNCNRDGLVSGTDAAYGNGNFVFYIQHQC